MSVSEDQVLALHQRLLAGESLADLGRSIGRSHEAVRLLFRSHGLPTPSNADRAAQKRAHALQEVEQRREEIIALYKRLGTVEGVLERVKLPRKLVAAIIDEIPNREAYRFRGSPRAQPREKVLEGLRQAAALKGEPLTIPAYREAARELGLVSYDTVVRPFRVECPEEPWAAALRAAGVRGNPSLGRRATALTPKQCVEAVMRCIMDHKGRRISLPEYNEWAGFNDAPSGISVRKVVGTWNRAVEQALDELARIGYHPLT